MVAVKRTDASKLYKKVVKANLEYFNQLQMEGILASPAIGQEERLKEWKRQYDILENILTTTVKTVIYSIEKIKKRRRRLSIYNLRE